MGLTDPVAICLAATALPANPTSWGDVSSWFRAQYQPKTFGVEMYSDESSGFTGLKLVAAIEKPVVIVDDGVDGVTHAADTLTITGHALKTGDGPIRFTTDGTLPGGIDATTDYYIGVVDANTVKLFASRILLLAGRTVALATCVDITSAGSGTHTLVDVQSGSVLTSRLHWFDMALLGPAADGVVTLDTVRGLVQRFQLPRRAVAMALVGTVGSGKMSAHAYLEAD